VTDPIHGASPTTEPACHAAVFLRAGGPARVPFLPCCAIALLRGARSVDGNPLPCPQRRELVSAAVPGDSPFLLTPVPPRSEVIP
jgi:hypothetical protein